MHTNQEQFICILIFAGIVFFGCGLLYRVPFIQRRDINLFNFLNLKLSRQILFFRLLWHMGKTPFMMTMLAILWFTDGPSGFQATLCFSLIACLERSLKLTLKRHRPFFILPDVQMSQPQQPNDPSHPSGDAMRIWYLAFVLPSAFGLPFWICLFFICIAFWVSLGRIAFGVHFPLDVIGGAGLGLIGAGLFQLWF